MNGPPNPSWQYSTSRRRVVSITLLILVFFLGLLIGSVKTSPAAITSLTDAIARLRAQYPNLDFSQIETTWNLVQNKYVGRPVEQERILRGALRGMIESLGDPYSFYLSPDEAKSFEDEINGKFEGIGAELGLKDDQVVVIAPLADTPAERAGVRSGDIIAAIDGMSTEGMTLEQAVLKIRGKAGTSVTLSIRRGDQPKLDITIQRTRIRLKSVTSEFRTQNDSLYVIVRISSFTPTTNDEFNQIVQTMLVRQPRAIVLDLRNNPGGFLDSAVAIADAFFSAGSIVIEDLGNDQRRTIDAENGAPLAAIPGAVLINGGTASAAEILAGALHDRLNFPLIGETSFGKGSVQEIQDLNDGSTIKLTVAKWLTPKGTSIDGKGIEPTESVPRTEQDIESQRDPQLERAFELLGK